MLSHALPVNIYAQVDVMVVLRDVIAKAALKILLIKVAKIPKANLKKKDKRGYIHVLRLFQNQIEIMLQLVVWVQNLPKNAIKNQVA
jgi:hypothetical protein